jgi:hypothetical protein
MSNHGRKDDFDAVEYALPRLQSLIRCPLHFSFPVPPEISPNI